MIPESLSPVANHLWQSTLFALAAGLLTLTVRKNRAAIRHAIWLAASLKFLVPFSLLISLGQSVEWSVPAAPIGPRISITLDQISEPFGPVASLPSTPVPSAPADSLPAVWFSVWLLGFLVVGAYLYVRMRRVYTTLRTATPIDLRLPLMAVSSSTQFEPGIVGLFRPVLLLPEGIIERLTPDQFRAVIAHEICHVRRRDNLTSFLHMIVEAVFWFHPLVWYMGARLVEERERACDEEVLRQGSTPETYAEGILNVCKLYVESPVTCVSGVTGSDLKKRIETIMRHHLALRLSFAKKAALTCSVVAAIVGPLTVGILTAQTKPARPKFDVASIKLNKDCGSLPLGAPQPSPGRIFIQCSPMRGYILSAYVGFASGIRYENYSVPIEGAPGWVSQDLYDIQAQAEGNPRQELMRGPMLQTLLEERLNLKIREEAREVPVYELTVAKGGAKIQPHREGECLPLDMASATERGEKPFCRTLMGLHSASSIVVDLQGVSLDTFGKRLSVVLERPVIDRTGLTGLFDIKLEFSPDQATPRAVRPGAEPTGPGVFTAIQEQLGLRLEAAKGPGKVLVIEHIERPSEN